MMMRQLPALCAGILMLAACADSVRQQQPPVNGVPSQAVTPGETSDADGYSNVGNTIYFALDSAELVAEAQSQLQREAKWLQQFPAHKLTIEGHADERGTREYNLALGERRAQAVMDYLIALGVDSKRLKTISYGKERPFCTKAEEACWSQNRRAVSTLDP
jgi:peptidoglycan-associated lipoprotein